MNIGTIFTPMYWECSELQFDTLIKKVGSGEAEKFMIVNTDKVSCVWNVIAIELYSPCGVLHNIAILTKLLLLS